MKSRAVPTARRHRYSAQNISPAIQDESPVVPGCRRSTEAVRSERTWGRRRTFAEYTLERVRNTCRILLHVGHRHRMQPQTNQAQQRRPLQGPGFYSYLAPFVSTFSGNKHLSASVLFVVGRLLNKHDKGSLAACPHKNTLTYSF